MIQTGDRKNQIKRAVGEWQARVARDLKLRRERAILVKIFCMGKQLLRYIHAGIAHTRNAGLFKKRDEPPIAATDIENVRAGSEIRCGKSKLWPRIRARDRKVIRDGIVIFGGLTDNRISN